MPSKSIRKPTKLAQGVIIPMITPLTEEGELDTHAVSKIINRFVDCQASVFLLGTTGEGLSLSSDVKADLVQYVCQHYEDKTTIYAGISHCCFDETIAQAKLYAAFGVDALVVHLPPYFPLTSHQMLNYFQSVIEAVSLPIVLYNIPQTTHHTIPLEVIDQLSHHPQVIALKDSENNQARLDGALTLWKERRDFSLLIGASALAQYGLERGADGLVPGVGNLIPELYDQLYRGSGGQEHVDKICAICQSIKPLSATLAALKVMMHHHGLCGKKVASPLTQLSLDVEESIIRSCRL